MTKRNNNAIMGRALATAYGAVGYVMTWPIPKIQAATGRLTAGKVKGKK